MAFRNESSARLYEELLREGYDRDLCYTIVVKYMNTDYTAERMLGYLARAGNPPEEELVDEMLAILSDREMYINKHINEESQARVSAWYSSEERADNL